MSRLVKITEANGKVTEVVWNQILDLTEFSKPVKIEYDDSLGPQVFYTTLKGGTTGSDSECFDEHVNKFNNEQYLIERLND